MPTYKKPKNYKMRVIQALMLSTLLLAEAAPVAVQAHSTSNSPRIELVQTHIENYNQTHIYNIEAAAARRLEEEEEERALEEAAKKEDEGESGSDTVDDSEADHDEEEEIDEQEPEVRTNRNLDLPRVPVIQASGFQPLAVPWTGIGTTDNPFQIGSLEQLENLREYTTAGYYFELIADLDFLGEQILPFPDFEGSLNGNGHSIRNFNISSSANFLGLFRSTTVGSVIRNLNIENASVQGTGLSTHSVGVLAGQVAGDLFDIHVTVSEVRSSGENVGGIAGAQVRAGTARASQITNVSFSNGNSTNEGIVAGRPFTSSVTGSSFTGGLFGFTEFATLTDCWTDTKVTGLDSVGGLVGESNGRITGTATTETGRTSEYMSRALGDVTGRNRVGGLVGDATAPITLSHVGENNPLIATDTQSIIIATGSDVGGLVGRAEAGATITWTYAVVSVQGGASNIGGLVGVAGANVSTSWTLTLDNGAMPSVYSTSATGQAIGGLVGRLAENMSVINSYATGENITRAAGGTNNAFIGGLVGGGSKGSSVSNSYSSNKVSGNTAIGGITGGNIQGSGNFRVTDCFVIGALSSGVGAAGAGAIVGNTSNMNYSNNWRWEGFQFSNNITGGGTFNDPSGIHGGVQTARQLMWRVTYGAPSVGESVPPAGGGQYNPQSSRKTSWTFNANPWVWGDDVGSVSFPLLGLGSETPAVPFLYYLIGSITHQVYNGHRYVFYASEIFDISEMGDGANIGLQDFSFELIDLNLIYDDGIHLTYENVAGGDVRIILEIDDDHDIIVGQYAVRAILRVEQARQWSSGGLFVTPREIAIDGQVASRIWDGTTVATWETSPSLTGVLSQDENALVLYYGNPEFGDSAVGTYLYGHEVEEQALIFDQQFSLTGNRAENYTLAAPDFTAEIQSIDMSAVHFDMILGTTVPRVYDGTPFAEVDRRPQLNIYLDESDDMPIFTVYIDSDKVEYTDANVGEDKQVVDHVPFDISAFRHPAVDDVNLEILVQQIRVYEEQNQLFEDGVITPAPLRWVQGTVPIKTYDGTAYILEEHFNAIVWPSLTGFVKEEGQIFEELFSADHFDFGGFASTGPQFVGVADGHGNTISVLETGLAYDSPESGTRSLVWDVSAYQPFLDIDSQPEKEQILSNYILEGEPDLATEGWANHATWAPTAIVGQVIQPENIRIIPGTIKSREYDGTSVAEIDRMPQLRIIMDTAESGYIEEDFNTENFIQFDLNIWNTHFSSDGANPDINAGANAILWEPHGAEMEDWGNEYDEPNPGGEEDEFLKWNFEALINFTIGDGATPAAQLVRNRILNLSKMNLFGPMTNPDFAAQTFDRMVKDVNGELVQAPELSPDWTLEQAIVYTAYQLGWADYAGEAQGTQNFMADFRNYAAFAHRWVSNSPEARDIERAQIIPRQIFWSTGQVGSREYDTTAFVYSISDTEEVLLQEPVLQHLTGPALIEGDGIKPVSGWAEFTDPSVGLNKDVRAARHYNPNEDRHSIWKIERLEADEIGATKGVHNYVFVNTAEPLTQFMENPRLARQALERGILANVEVENIDGIDFSFIQPLFEVADIYELEIDNLAEDIQELRQGRVRKAFDGTITAFDFIEERAEFILSKTRPVIVETQQVGIYEVIDTPIVVGIHFDEESFTYFHEGVAPDLDVTHWWDTDADKPELIGNFDPEQWDDYEAYMEHVFKYVFNKQILISDVHPDNSNISFSEDFLANFNIQQVLPLGALNLPIIRPTIFEAPTFKASGEEGPFELYLGKIDPFVMDKEIVENGQVHIIPGWLEKEYDGTVDAPAELREDDWAVIEINVNPDWNDGEGLWLEIFYDYDGARFSEKNAGGFGGGYSPRHIIVDGLLLWSASNMGTDGYNYEVMEFVEEAVNFLLEQQDFYEGEIMPRPLTWSQGTAASRPFAVGDTGTTVARDTDDQLLVPRLQGILALDEKEFEVFTDQELIQIFSNLTFMDGNVPTDQIGEWMIAFDFEAPDSWIVDGAAAADNYLLPDEVPTFAPASITGSNIYFVESQELALLVVEREYDGTRDAGLVEDIYDVLVYFDGNSEDIETIQVRVRDVSFDNPDAGEEKALTIAAGGIEIVDDSHVFGEPALSNFYAAVKASFEENSVGTIRQRRVTWTEAQVADKVYDGTTVANIEGDMPELTRPVGLTGDAIVSVGDTRDDISVQAGQVEFDNPNVGSRAEKTVHITEDWTVLGQRWSNYILVNTDNTEVAEDAVLNPQIHAGAITPLWIGEKGTDNPEERDISELWTDVIDVTRQYDGTTEVYQGTKSDADFKDFLTLLSEIIIVTFDEADDVKVSLTAATVNFDERHVPDQNEERSIVIEGLANHEDNLNVRLTDAALDWIESRLFEGSIDPRVLQAGQGIFMPRAYTGNSYYLPNFENDDWNLVTLPPLVGRTNFHAEDRSVLVPQSRAEWHEAPRPQLLERDIDPASWTDPKNSGQYVISGLDWWIAGSIYDQRNFAVENQPTFLITIGEKDIENWDELIQMGLANPGHVEKVYDRTVSIIGVDDIQISAPQLTVTETSQTLEVDIEEWLLQFAQANVGDNIAVNLISVEAEEIIQQLQDYIDEVFGSGLIRLTSEFDIHSLFTGRITARELTISTGSLGSHTFTGNALSFSDFGLEYLHNQGRPELEGIIAGDEVLLPDAGVNQVTWPDDAINVGLYDNVEGQGWTILEGEQAANYKLLAEPLLSFEITPAQLQNWEDLEQWAILESKGGVSKEYDGQVEIDLNKHVIAPSYRDNDGILQELDISLWGLSFAQADVGSELLIGNTEVALASLEALLTEDNLVLAENFNLSSIFEAVIEPRLVAWSQGQVADKVYDRNRSAQFKDSEHPKLIYAGSSAGEQVALVEVDKPYVTWNEGLIEFESAEIGANKIVSIMPDQWWTILDSSPQGTWSLNYRLVDEDGEELDLQAVEPIIQPTLSRAAITPIVLGTGEDEPIIIPLPDEENHGEDVEVETPIRNLQTWTSMQTIDLSREYDGTEIILSSFYLDHLSSSLLYLWSETESQALVLEVDDVHFAHRHTEAVQTNTILVENLRLANSQDFILTDKALEYLTQHLFSGEITPRQIHWNQLQVEDKYYDRTRTAVIVNDEIELIGRNDGRAGILTIDQEEVIVNKGGASFVDFNVHRDTQGQVIAQAVQAIGDWSIQGDMAENYEIVAASGPQAFALPRFSALEPEFEPAIIRPRPIQFNGQIEMRKVFDRTADFNGNLEEHHIYVSLDNGPHNFTAMIEGVDPDDPNLAIMHIGAEDGTPNEVLHDDVAKSLSNFIGQQTVNGLPDANANIQPQYTAGLLEHNIEFGLRGAESGNYQLVGELPNIVTRISQAPGPDLSLAVESRGETAIRVQPANILQDNTPAPPEMSVLRETDNDFTIVYTISDSPDMSRIESYSENPEIWQEGRDFEGLEADTTYYIFAQSIETRNHYQGPITEALSVRTSVPTLSRERIPALGDSAIAIGTLGLTLSASAIYLAKKRRKRSTDGGKRRK